MQTFKPTCIMCGTILVLSRFNNNKKFCSKLCAFRWRTKIRKVNVSGKYIVKEIIGNGICTICGLMARKYLMEYKSNFSCIQVFHFKHIVKSIVTTHIDNKRNIIYGKPRTWVLHKRKPESKTCKINGCSTDFESIKALREHKDKEHRI